LVIALRSAGGSFAMRAIASWKFRLYGFRFSDLDIEVLLLVRR
jgi:hypothetical protein